MALTEDLNIYRSMYKLLLALIDARNDFDKSFKYVVGERLINTALDCVTLIHFANEDRHKGARAEATDESGRIKMLDELRASVNSYLGMMVHFNSYKIRRKIAEQWILPIWGKYVYFLENFSVMKIRHEFDEKMLLRRRLKHRKFAAKFIRPTYHHPPLPPRKGAE